VIETLDMLDAAEH